MPTCCKAGSIESQATGIKSYIQTDVGTKLKSIVRAIALRRTPSISEVIDVSLMFNFDCIEWHIVQSMHYTHISR
jgi:hypothetical protein